jgi:hypothetical protein
MALSADWLRPFALNSTLHSPPISVKSNLRKRTVEIIRPQSARKHSLVSTLLGRNGSVVASFLNAVGFPWLRTVLIAALKRRKAAHSKGFARFVASNVAKRLECGAFHRFSLRR